LPPLILLLRVSQLNRHLSQNLPLPLFAKEGDFTSLWRLFPVVRQAKGGGEGFCQIMSLLL
jgi:hypothetical protein